VLQKALKQATSEAGVNKPVHAHSLRHYAEFRIMPSRFRMAA
jgi:site-specific recombinase XerD